MFRWCSYCQSFIGQREPLYDYSLTHGICDICKKNFYENKILDNHEEKVRPLINFYQDLRSKAIIGVPIDSLSLFTEAKDLKIKPADLLAGMIQPLLYEIGVRYQDGTLQVYEEHLFSEFTSSLINELKREYRLLLPYNETADVLLFLADNEKHEFGVRFLEVFLLQEGIKTKAILPSLPTEQIFKVSQKFKPQVIGLSITDPTEYDNLLESLNVFKDWKEAPQIILGGQGVNPKKEVKFPFVKLHQGNLKNFLELIQLELNQSRKKSA